MGTRYTESLMSTSKSTEHLSSFLQVEAMIAEISKFAMVGRHRWGIDHKSVVAVETWLGYELEVVFIMYLSAFLFELASKVTWRLVVATNDESTMEEVAGKSTHADASDSDEIY